MRVKCNICNCDIDDSMVEEHTSSNEHKENLEKVKGLIKDKMYDDDSMRLGIEA